LKSQTPRWLEKIISGNLPIHVPTHASAEECPVAASAESAATCLLLKIALVSAPSGSLCLLVRTCAKQHYQMAKTATGERRHRHYRPRSPMPDEAGFGQGRSGIVATAYFGREVLASIVFSHCQVLS
jgi:hypothetical protein